MTSNILFFNQLELLKQLESVKDEKFFAVIDVKVKNLLPQWLQLAPNIYWLHNPEDQKNIDSYRDCCEFFLKIGVQRKDVLYAIGGGATTDLTGFVAATLNRGMKWKAVPTTLIGMVDAAIGGKTGINSVYGKNLIGAFHLPEEVWISTSFLKTLSSNDIFSGRGEIAKYALLSQDIYDEVMRSTINWDEILVKCAAYKKSVVERDFKESGERAYLNLGHTLGHAFERELGLPHGIAVAMGLKYKIEILSLDDLRNNFEEIAKKLEFDLNKLELKNYPNFNFSQFWNYITHDKKRADERIQLVSLAKIGEPFLHSISLVELKKTIEAHPDFSL